jgi:flagellar assembly protein FliH
MPFADSGYRVLRAGSDAALAAGVTELPRPDLPAHDWADTNELARTMLGEVAETARAEAQAQGYAVGWAQGRRDARMAAADATRRAEQAAREAELRREAEHRAAVTALHRAADELRGAVEEACGTVALQGTDLALALTETLLGHELSTATDADVVRRTLRLMPAPTTATVRLHPDVAASAAVQQLSDAGLTVVADPSLQRDDALVEVDGSVTDLRISTAMERLRQALA